ncbi:hypothetical protein PFISCL1PPCAC_12511, partial [Pristionchus fissidentatus]
NLQMKCTTPHIVNSLPEEEGRTIMKFIGMKEEAREHRGIGGVDTSDSDGEEEGGGGGARNDSALKWDCLVLTAMNEKQKRIFEMQLEDVDWRRYAKKAVVLQDPPGVRAGSGGATVWLLTQNQEQHCFQPEDKVLLIHSGGLSQRTPHLSNVGKVFMTTPDDHTLILCKLKMLKSLVPAINAGLFICASDVLERLPKTIDKLENDVDFLLLMHRSPLEIAFNHGVYALGKEGLQLLRVLQKPTEKKMRDIDAIQVTEGVEWAFTDSAYFMSMRMADKLIAFCGRHERKSELCVYGDFLKPLGSFPDYIKSEPVNGDPETQSMQENQMIWTLSLRACFSGSKVQLLDCGSDSFYHFGSIAECRDNLYGNLRHHPIPVHSTWEYSVGYRSIVEYCSLPANNTTVGQRSIVSNCYVGDNRNGKKISIPDDVVVYSTPVIKDNVKGWVTVVIGARDDVKKIYEKGEVEWTGVKITDYEGLTLWDAPVFMKASGAEDSLMSSLRKYKHRKTDPEVLTCCGWSMADVVKYVDVDKLIEFRKQRRQLWWQYGPASLGEPSADDQPHLCMSDQ